MGPWDRGAIWNIGFVVCVRVTSDTLRSMRAASRLFFLGLSAIVSEGEDFNPEVHEAVEIVPVETDQDNKVIAEYQTGYKFGDRLLRPARVRVGRAS